MSIFLILARNCMAMLQRQLVVKPLKRLLDFTGTRFEAAISLKTTLYQNQL
jgi:hypothetical protein